MDVGGGREDTRLEDLHPDMKPAGVHALCEPAVDMTFLRQLVEGVSARRETLDVTIDAHLSPTWPPDRLEALLRAILRVGVYELGAFPKLPVKITINEYVDLAHSFFAGREPALVNAVLDGIAAATRGDAGPRLSDNGQPVD